MLDTDKFYTRVVAGHDNCHVWTGSTDKGYGRFRDSSGRLHYAHRWIYIYLLGDPGKLQIDHLCRNRRCVNVSHLEAVTQRTNILRGEGPSAINAKKTECPLGHPYTEENTYVSPRTGKRFCVACRPRWQ